MQSNDLISEIGRILTSAEVAQVLAGLREDALVWQNLQEADFLKTALNGAGSQVRCWSPGQMALLALTETQPAEALRSEPLVPLNANLQERALQAYQAVKRSGKAPQTLSEVALLALTLRERRRLTGTWSGLLQELLPRQTSFEEVVSVWRTPLACLYALIPDPEEMLRSLLPKTPTRSAFEWITHTQLSQPLSQAEHVQVFSRLMQGLLVPSQLHLLRSISLHGREVLAAELADRLLVGNPAFASLHTQSIPNELDLIGLSSRAISLQQMGAFYQLSGNHAEALSLYQAAEQTLEQWHAGLYLQRLTLKPTGGKGSNEVLLDSQHISQLASAAGWLKDELGCVLVSHPYGRSILEQIPEENNGAFLQIKRAAQLFEREPAVARDLARQGATNLLTGIQQQGLPFRGDFITNWQPKDTLQILIDMELPEEALNLTLAALEVRPNDTQLLQTASQIYQQSGKLDKALQFASNLTALEPQNPAWRRILANLWQQAKTWEQAYQEWQVVLKLSQQPSLIDQIACAQAAFQAGHAQETERMSKAVLEEDANLGTAEGLLGQALVSQGQSQEAVSHLVRATLLTPELLPPWLTLAQVQQEMGESQRALETLRAAVTAVPEAPEGQFALGQACVNAGLLADALPHLKRAFSRSTDNPTALLYGQTLRILGHTAEARAVLEHVQPQWAACPDLAYEYALALIDQGEAEMALPVLESALRNGLPVLNGHLIYAKILLGEYASVSEDRDEEIARTRMQQADQALQRILENDPNNLEARFLVADILREKGQLNEALEAYRELADLPSASSPELRFRIQWGMGRTALGLGEMGIALAALQEACQIKPENLALQRNLAEISLSANLPNEAQEAAENALQLAADDVENLSWYAQFVANIGNKGKAIQALERAVQIDPQRADLMVALAQWQLSNGDLAAARNSLEKVSSQEMASYKDFRRAAQVYLRLEDPQSAIALFERALETGEPVPAELLLEAAQLHQRLGNLEPALELTQKALELDAENLPVYILQADLLAYLNRPQAALALLERALRVTQSKSESQVQKGLRSSLLSQIHERFTRLFLQENNLLAALDHAEEAFNINPGQVSLCYRATDLALALLQNERAKRIIRAGQFGEDGPLTLLESGPDGLELLGLHIEMALNAGQVELATLWLNEALPLLPQNARFQAAQARLQALKGTYANAQQTWKTARSSLKLVSANAVPFWLAEAALEVALWEEASSLSEQYIQAHSSEARGHLGFARALVLAAEMQRTCEALNCRVNAPGTQVLDESHRQKLEEAIRAASRQASISEIGRWQARGQAVFAPSAQNARALAAMPAQPEDIAALVAILRQLNNPAAAIQVARRYQEDPKVALQLAICQLSQPGPEAVADAEKAVALNPHQPLAHAVRAQIDQKSGDCEQALAAYENALQIWPNEPVWHDNAGDLSMQKGDLPFAKAHRKQALALEPKNARYAFKVGQACLADEDLSDAIGSLETSSELDSEQAEVWLTLGKAYHMAGQLAEALAAAQKAGQLDPASAESLLVAGETALAMEQKDLALELAQDAVRREPENAAAVLFLSNVLVMNEQIEAGLDTLEKAAPAVKATFPVAFERAKLIRHLHGAKAAIEILEKLAREYPEEPGLLSFLAKAQAECGDQKAAERYAFKALALDGDQPDLTLMLGRLQRKSGQLDQAVHLLSEAIQMAPDNLEAYLELGGVYQDRREHLSALQVFSQAMRVAPHDFQAFYQSGLILRDSKDYSAAETMLRRAAELAPDNLSIRRQLVGVIAMNLVHNHQEASVS